jgi:hypothetical protein
MTRKREEKISRIRRMSILSIWRRMAERRKRLQSRSLRRRSSL